jgi:hypothetical protein
MFGGIDLLSFERDGKSYFVGGDGVPPLTAQAGLMTPIAQADAAVGVCCEVSNPLRSGFFVPAPGPGRC